MKKQINHINYALVEDVRPPMYKATKYWGKKPHNIWRQFIEAYSDINETILDPFSGSAVAAFEAVKSKRKSIAFDLNPITCFTIESICSDFNEVKFKTAFKQIENTILSDAIYQKHYTTKHNGKEATIFNYKWKDGIISSISLKTGKESYSIQPNEDLINITSSQSKIDIPYWFPKDNLP